MGLLDWLSDAIGSSNGSGGNMLSESSPFGNPASGMGGPPTPPAAPMPESLPPTPPMAQSGGIGSDAARSPSQPPIPPSPAPTPPMPPPMAGPAGAPPMPPGGVDAPGAIKSYQGAGGTMMTPGAPEIPVAGQGPQARNFLGRALGLDANSDRSLMSSIGSGLTAAGNSAGKSKFQAFAGGAGAAIEGGNKEDKQTTTDQQKYLDQAIKAAQSGDARELALARTKLLEAQTKMTLQGNGGKNSVVNSPEQLYFRAVGAANQDGQLKLLQKAHSDAVAGRGAASPEAVAAKKAYDDAYQEKLNGHLAAAGIDPKQASKFGKAPGSQDNPIPKTKMTSQADFDKLHPGQFFINPKDGQTLMKPLPGVGGAAAAMGPNGQQPAAGASAGGTTLPAGQGGVPAPTGSNLPPMPPSAPTNPVATSNMGFGADESDDEKEAA